MMGLGRDVDQWEGRGRAWRVVVVVMVVVVVNDDLWDDLWDDPALGKC